MGYHIIGADLTEVTFIDQGTTVVLEDTGDTLKITNVGAFDATGIQFKASGGTDTLSIQDDGSVGIGTASPSDYPDEKNNLVIYENANVGMSLISSGTGIASIAFGMDTSHTNKGWIDYSNNTKQMRLGTNGNSTAVTIDSEQRLGLGIDSPSDYVDEKNNFVLGATTGHTGMTIVSGNTAIGTIQFRGDTSVNNNEGWIDYSQNTQKMRFGTNGLNTPLTLENDQKATFAGDVDVAGDLTVKGHDIKAQDGTICMTLNDSTGARPGYVDFAASIRLSEDNYIGTPHGGTLIKLDGTADRVDITGGIKTTGGQIVSVRAVTAATATIAADDYIITADTSSNTITFTLPSATVVGQTYQIKDLGNASANNITINVAGSDTIDGASSLTISTNYANAVLVCTASTKWSIL